MFDHERILLKKLLSTILCAILILSMMPNTIIKAEESPLKVNLIDYVDTYYQGFNDNICMAQGTTIQIEYNGNVGMFVVGNAYEKDSEKEIIYSIVSDEEEDMGKAGITFADGQVHLKWYAPDDRTYEKDLYEPQYLPLDNMPILGLDEGEIIASEDKGGAVCERYYRIHEEAGAYIAYTKEIDSDSEDDTYVCLYDEEGEIINYNDDGENAPYSFLTFDVASGEERIIGVRNYDCENGKSLDNTRLVLIRGASSIDLITSDNVEDATPLYEGFNHKLMVGIGSRIQVEYDNGIIADSVIWPEVEEGDDTHYAINDYSEVSFVKKDDGIYAVGHLRGRPDEQYEFRLFSPVIKDISDMPEIIEGDSKVMTPRASEAYNYYRISAGSDNETWRIWISMNEAEKYEDDFTVKVSSVDGKQLYEGSAQWNSQTGKYEMLCIIDIPADSSGVIGIKDTDDNSVVYNLTAQKYIRTASEKNTTEGDDNGAIVIPDETEGAGNESIQNEKNTASESDENTGKELDDEIKKDVSTENEGGTSHADNSVTRDSEKAVNDPIRVGTKVYTGEATYTVTKSAGNSVRVKYNAPGNINKTSYNIPDTVKLTDGRIAKVTAIAPKALVKCKKARKVTIGRNVNNIGGKAFYGCKKLKTITIKSTKLTKKSFGKNVFKGIYKKAAFKCPKKQLKNYKKWIGKAGAPKRAKYKK